MKKNSGFIHIVLVIVVIAIVLLYFGKNPILIWEQVRPIFANIFELFLSVIDWLINLITRIWITK